MTARIVAQSSVMVSRDVPAAIRHWCGVFGFVLDNSFGEPPSFAILRRDGAYVMLGATDTPVVPRREQRAGLFDAYFWLDDAVSAFDEMKARGARIDYAPCLQSYGVLEFGLLDPDNHLIAFGQVMPSSSP